LNASASKWIRFAALLLRLPAMLFLVAAVMFVPAVFFMAGMGYVFLKMLRHGNLGENLGFLAILAVPALVYAGLCYGLAAVAAKLIHLIRRPPVRWAIVAVLCLGLGLLAQVPVYGAGGHGPMHWQRQPALLGEIDRTYSAGSALAVYGATLLWLAGHRQWRRRVSPYAGRDGNP